MTDDEAKHILGLVRSHLRGAIDDHVDLRTGDMPRETHCLRRPGNGANGSLGSVGHASVLPGDRSRAETGVIIEEIRQYP